MEQQKYEGQKYVEGQEATDVPENPAESEGSDAPGQMRQGFGTGTYAKVTMIGNYGAFCGQHQTLHFQNVTLAQARKLKWDYFGACGATMTCFDSQGNVVYEE